MALPRRAAEPQLLLPTPDTGEPDEPDPWRPRRRPPGLIAGVVLAAVLVGLLVVGLFGPAPPRPNLASLLFGVGIHPVLVLGAVLGGDLGTALRAPRSEPADALRPVPVWAAPALAAPLVLLRTAGRLGGREVALLVIAYLLVTVAGRLRCGRAWWRDGDAVAVLVRVLARLSPVERREDAWRRRPWPGGLAVALGPAERAVLVVVLAGAIARAATWLPVVVRATSGRSAWVIWAVDLGLLLYVLAVLVLADRAIRTITGVTVGVALVPLTAALLLANDAAGALYTADLSVTLLSDPLGTGADLFGTADRRISLAVLASPLTWLAQLVLVLFGAVLGATTQRDLDRRHGVTSAAGPLAVVGVAAAALVLLLAA